MIRTSLVTACVALTLALASGCNQAADEQRKADEARAEANEKIDEANREANVKIDSARAASDKSVTEAQANFLKLREDFRHETTNHLVDLDKKIVDLEAKVKTSKGKARAELEAKLPGIRAQRDAFVNDYKSIEVASATTWDQTKARLEKEWDDLKKAVDDAS